MLDYSFVEPESLPESLPSRADPYDLAPLRDRLAPYEQELAAMKARAETLKISDEQSAEEAAALGATCAKIEKAVEASRAYFKQPALEFGRNIDAFCRVYTEKAQAAKRTLSSKLGAWQAQKKKEALEQLRKEQEAAVVLQKQIEDEAKEAGTDALVQLVIPRAASPQTPIRTEAGNATLVEKWVCTVLDPALVPREYCEVKQSLLNAAVRAGIRDIPGCRIELQANTRFGG
jgi:hypothetical protein